MTDDCLHFVIYKHQQQNLKLPELATELYGPPVKLGRTMCWDGSLRSSTSVVVPVGPLDTGKREISLPYLSFQLIEGSAHL